MSAVLYRGLQSGTQILEGGRALRAQSADAWTVLPPHPAPPPSGAWTASHPDTDTSTKHGAIPVDAARGDYTYPDHISQAL